MPQLEVGSYPMQLVWLAIIFVLLLVLMAYVALPKVGAAIKARADRIDGDLARAAEARAEAEAVMAEHQRAVTAARAETQTILKGILDGVAEERAREEHKVADRLAEEARAAEARIAAAKAEALAGVRQIAAEAAQAATQRLLGVALPLAEADAAVGHALEERR